MATPIYTNVTADNWRQARGDWAARANLYGWNGLVDEFLGIGAAGLINSDYMVDDEFCADAVAATITRTLEFAHIQGVTL